MLLGPRVCFERFLEALRRDTGADTIGLVLDNSGSHSSGKVRWPEGLAKIALPPYSPELNPAERWFEALRRVFANVIFDTVEELEAALTEALRPYWQNPAKLQRLVGYPWWCRAITGLSNTASPPSKG
jgi:transposase